MRRTSIGLGILVAIIGTLLTAPGTTQSRRGRPLDIQRVNGREAVAREVLVRFHDAQQPQRAPGNVPETDPERVERLGPSGLLRLRSRSLSVTALLSALARRGDVAYAEPNYVVHAYDDPTDPLWPQLWGLKNIGQAVNGGGAGLAGSDIRVSEAWSHSVGSELNVVAVVDTGVDYTHPDLAPNMWSAPWAFTVTIDGTDITCPAGTHGFNAIDLSCDPMDDHNHGSHVAGTIGAAGDNGIGVVGVNRVARIMGLKFLDASGSGSVGDAIRAIEFARQVKQAFGSTQSANVRVLSNSWGGGGFSQALLDAINAAAADNMLFVAAAGNSGYPTDFFPTYPASYNAASIVSVAATTNTDERAWFSNYGSTTVDLGAPGVNILSTTLGNTYSFSSGTSMATPHVSGAAALVLSRCSLDTEDLKEALLSSVDPVPSLASKTVTGGRLNVNSAIEACRSLPGVPGDLTATGGDRQVRLSWSAATGATSYRVKRSLTAGGPYVPVAANVKTPAYIDSDLVNGTTYYYVVSAVNVLGESADSNEASAVPRTPSDLVVSSFSVPGAGGSGRPIAISVTTRNQGAGSAEPSTTRLYLSDDPTVDSSDSELNLHRVVPALAAGASDSASFSVLLPSGVEVGPHYILAKADADDVLFEGQEGNNTRARYIQIGADLVVSSFTVPLTAAPGASISVLDTTTNQGGDGTEASATRFYLSTNATLDAGDTLLADRQIPVLEPAGSSSAQTTLAIPATLARGSYYVIAEADGANAVAEIQETNNTAARPLQVGGDLLVSAFTVPAKGGADRDLTLTDTTTNQGSDAVPATVTKFYLSANSQLDASDTPLAASHAVPSLAPGASHAGSTTVRIPANAVSGTHYLIAKADADGAAAETDEGNNTVARSIQIGADLIVSSLTRPSKVGAGDSVTVAETTTNQGGGNAGASATHFYLSTNAVLDATDSLLTGHHAVGALAAGASSTGSTTIVIPGGTAPGSYYLFAKADAGNAVNETQETNNTAVKTVSIGPDMVVSSVFVTSPVAAGSTTSVTDTVLNQGGGTTGPSVTRFYLSANNMLDATDVLLPEKRDVPGLAADASNSGTTSVTIPPGTAPGSYYVLAKADGDSSISESVETNNAAPRGIQVN